MSFQDDLAQQAIKHLAAGDYPRASATLIYAFRETGRPVQVQLDEFVRLLGAALGRRFPKEYDRWLVALRAELAR
ncbi:hypothetical protein ABZ951_00610 [Streptomyces sp. NPDC046215]|uniref:Uncharacterized protein n=1 Tax=Streptomyces stramineus TaxID=173861 RepID=A0ABN0ZNV6_9ACTN